MAEAIHGDIPTGLVFGVMADLEMALRAATRHGQEDRVLEALRTALSECVAESISWSDLLASLQKHGILASSPERKALSADLLAPCSLTTGDVVLDTDYLQCALPYLRTKTECKLPFTALDVLDLFALAEALVLHERLLTGSVFEGIERLTRYADIVALIQRGIIRHHGEIEAELSRELKTRCRSIWRKIAGDVQCLCQEDWGGEEFTLSASFRKAQWSHHAGIDHLAWSAFGSLPRVAIAMPAESMIRKVYAAASTSLKRQVIQLQGVGCPVPMYIPPIPAIVLDRCAGEPRRFLEETLSLRDELRPFRKKYRQYQDLVGNPGKRTLGELSQSYQDAVADVSRELNCQGAKRADSHLIYDIWDAVCEVGTGGDLGDPKAAVGLNLGALLSKGLRGLQIRRIKARARSLFDLSRKVMGIRQYGQLVTRTFRIDANQLHKSLMAAERLGGNCDAIASVKREELWGAL